MREVARALPGLFRVSEHSGKLTVWALPGRGRGAYLLDGVSKDEVNRYLPLAYEPPAHGGLVIPRVEELNPTALEALRVAERPDLGLRDHGRGYYGVQRMLRTIVDYMTVKLPAGTLSLLEGRNAAMRAVSASAP